METPQQHHIIKDTSDTLARFLQDEYRRAGYKRVHIVDQAPKPDVIEGKLPAVSAYLYQVSLDSEGTDGNVHSELVTVTNDDGTTEEFRRQRRLWIRLDYLISTWAQTPEDEQILLGLAIRAIMENPALRGDRLRGASFDSDFALYFALSTRLDESTLSHFWGSLSQPIRPAIQTWTTIPIVPEALVPFQRVSGRRLDFRDINSPGVVERGATQEDRARAKPSGPAKPGGPKKR